jgi:thiol-disulfide isomerase/thioredoxin
MSRFALRLLAAVACLASPLLHTAPGLASERHLGPGRFLHRQGSRTLSDLLTTELIEARKKQQGVIVMFTADWCSPCKEIKQFVAGSQVVRKALTKGRLLYVDVDEWRGPAQSLFAGIDASKLPTLVRVGDDMRPMRHCFGTELGLLSEDSVAHNLGRLLQGLAPEKPQYEGKADAERELIRRHADAQAAQTKGVPELEVKPAGKGRWHIVIRNHDGPRRWYVLPAQLDQPLTDKPAVTSWAQVRWTEHVRADFLRFVGRPSFVAVPVAGYGSVELASWPLAGASKDGKLHVWELDRLAVDGQEQTFQMKLPYELHVQHADQERVWTSHGAGKVELKMRKDHAAALK